jgi:putative hydrolase of the HAD superfamily
MTASAGVRAIAFDLGGVLVDVDHARAAARLGVSLDAWAAAWFDGPHHDDISTGRIDADAFAAIGAARLGCPAVDAKEAWAAVVEVWPGASALVDDVLRRGLRVLVWSNTDPIHSERMALALPAIGTARGLSWRLGALKPDPAFYPRALDADLLPDHVLFLDDRADNVAAARAAGVHAAHVDPAAGSGIRHTTDVLRSWLERLGMRAV